LFIEWLDLGDRLLWDLGFEELAGECCRVWSLVEIVVEHYSEVLN
jgi:hypothetical protein